MASARPVMEPPVPAKQTGVVLEMSVDEARVLRCLVGSVNSSPRLAISNFIHGSGVHGKCGAFVRDEYLEVLETFDVFSMSNQLLLVIKEGLPEGNQ